MKEWSEVSEGEILDCSSLTISYQPNGLATIGYTIYLAKGSPLPYTDEGGGGLDLKAGGVNFTGWITSVQPDTTSDVDADSYKITAFAIGCKAEN